MGMNLEFSDADLIVVSHKDSGGMCMMWIVGGGLLRVFEETRISRAQALKGQHI